MALKFHIKKSGNYLKQVEFCSNKGVVMFTITIYISFIINPNKIVVMRRIL